MEKSYHTVIINDMGNGNYYESVSIEDSVLIKGIEHLIENAKGSVDKTERDLAPDQRLYDLSFR